MYYHRVTADKLYACKYTADDNWYRAWAYDYTPSHVMVQYLDYANYEAVPLSNLHPLEGNYRSLQFQAVCCSLGAIEGNFNFNCLTHYLGKKDLLSCTMD